VTTLLRLDGARIEKLDRAYETYARARLEQEARIAAWQEDLRRAQAATTFDERKAAQLSGSVSGAENKIATAYLKARGEALNALTSSQRIELEKIAVANRQVRDDKYRFLLLSEVEDLWRTPIDPETGQALLSASARAGASTTSQRNYYQNYYPAPPIFNSPIYSYGWNSFDYGYGYDYGFQSPFYSRPFYARPNYRWRDDNYSENDRIDRNARPRWNRSEGDTRPPVTFGSQAPRTVEPRRPLYIPQSPISSRDSGSTRPPAPVQRPQEERRPIVPVIPQWERQRESPRPEPPRIETRRPEPSSNDAGSRWDRGGGSRGDSGGGSRSGRRR
jgi:hypothetical protein